jgi:heat shock protein HtpX
MKGLNTFKTFFLLALLTLLLVFIGRVLGGQAGALVALVLAGAMNLASYWWSDKIVLRMYRAREIEYRDHPELHLTVQRLASRAGLPMPRVYLIPQSVPNAFATGRDPEHAAVAVTTGILESLNSSELEGVIGHELAHVRNRDILIGSVVATIAGAIAYMANMAQWAAIFGGFGRSSDDEDGGGGNLFSWLFLAILSPIVATMIQLAISRSREFLADRVGAEISGRPLELAGALRKLEKGSSLLPMHGSNATAHLFIVSPLTGGGLAGLFRTHPTTEERVRRLHEYATQGLVTAV